MTSIASRSPARLMAVRCFFRQTQLLSTTSLNRPPALMMPKKDVIGIDYHYYTNFTRAFSLGSANFKKKKKNMNVSPDEDENHIDDNKEQIREEAFSSISSSPSSSSSSSTSSSTEHRVIVKDGDDDIQPSTSTRFNFDYAKGSKRLFVEDGVPDILYRRIEVLCLAHETPLLDSYQTFVQMATQGLHIPVDVEEPCRVAERKTVLRAAFVHKKIRTQYEWYTHYRLFKFFHLTGSTADTLLEYLQRNLPEGMAMEVTKTRVEKLPSGVIGEKGETPTKEDVFAGRLEHKH